MHRCIILFQPLNLFIISPHYRISLRPIHWWKVVQVHTTSKHLENISSIMMGNFDKYLYVCIFLLYISNRFVARIISKDLKRPNKMDPRQLSSNVLFNLYKQPPRFPYLIIIAPCLFSTYFSIYCLIICLGDLSSQNTGSCAYIQFSHHSPSLNGIWKLIIIIFWLHWRKETPLESILGVIGEGVIHHHCGRNSLAKLIIF